jgi:hypothetical protein
MKQQNMQPAIIIPVALIKYANVGMKMIIPNLVELEQFKQIKQDKSERHSTQ